MKEPSTGLARIDDEHIDNCLCVLYDSGMATKMLRLRPVEMCCDPLVEPVPMSVLEHERLIAMFKALGDKTRLEIFRLIAAQSQPICACEIVDRFDVSQPTVAHHTKALREAGLIRASKIGIWAYYEPDREGLAALGSAVEAFLPEAVQMSRHGGLRVPA
jgi:ArsR family transcriptional regulator